jgi:hypothetical protein
MACQQFTCTHFGQLSFGGLSFGRLLRSALIVNFDPRKFGGNRKASFLSKTPGGRTFL